MIGYIVTYTKVTGGATLYEAFQRSVSQCYLVNLPGMITYGIRVGLLSNGSETIWSEEVFATTLERGG